MTVLRWKKVVLRTPSFSQSTWAFFDTEWVHPVWVMCQASLLNPCFFDAGHKCTSFSKYLLVSSLKDLRKICQKRYKWHVNTPFIILMNEVSESFTYHPCNFKSEWSIKKIKVDKQPFEDINNEQIYDYRTRRCLISTLSNLKSHYESQRPQTNLTPRQLSIELSRTYIYDCLKNATLTSY